MTAAFGLGLGFGAPWLLLALLILPVIWFVLRALPPAPVRRRFAGVGLLLGLQDAQAVVDRTPLWLLVLRAAIAGLIILGLAGPVLNPAPGGDRPAALLIVIDNGWPGAADWPERQKTLAAHWAEAVRTGRQTAILSLTAPPAPLVFQPASPGAGPIAPPMPWLANAEQALALVPDDIAFDTLWVSDGVDFAGRAALLDRLSQRGQVRVLQPPNAPVALAPPQLVDGAIEISALRLPTLAGPQSVRLMVHGLDPAGNPAVLSTHDLRFAAGQDRVVQRLTVPAELRARIRFFALEGQRSAGAVQLADDALQRRKIALVAGQSNREGPQLLSPLYYLDRALSPNATLLDLPLGTALPANPDVIILADVAQLPPAEAKALAAWVSRGGVLLRFAGPRLAAQPGGPVPGGATDPAPGLGSGEFVGSALLPVPLRAGGRDIGGALSWGTPKALAPFSPASPFWGLQIPDDIRVRAQVIAQPGPALADAVIAALADGTPLVTRAPLGQGQVVLFHVTATGEWSNLPLSGLFVQMLERLAVSAPAQRPSAQSLEGTVWAPQSVLDGFGSPLPAGQRKGVAGPDLVAAPLGPDLWPGRYRNGAQQIARNVVDQDAPLTPAVWPDGVVLQGDAPPRPLGGMLLGMALALLALDVAATLALGGRLVAPLLGGALGLSMGLLLPSTPSHAQPVDPLAQRATGDLVLAHVLTGNAPLDDLARAGLFGLSETLFFRTSVEPALPIGVNLETDELAFFPMLYWPITPDQPTPSAQAYAKLNAYLRHGGMIFFDTRDGDIAQLSGPARQGSTTGPGANARKLQALAAPLDIPPLAPLAADHILTRTFYLLQDFPGRYTSRDIWVEAPIAGNRATSGQPFRQLNDGVTPVVIGGNDWASAWAMRRDGSFFAPIGRGLSGERQRELAFRFGVNLVMHVLTGNYKSDQVHIPALLDRLGQ